MFWATLLLCLTQVSQHKLLLTIYSKFPKEQYTGTFTQDLLAEEDATYFDDVDQFSELQKQAAEIKHEEAQSLTEIPLVDRKEILPQTPGNLFWPCMAAIGSCRVFRWRSWSMT